MDYVEGKTLNELIDEQEQLRQDQTLRIFIQACEALGHAHSRGVIHRDIKPSNMLVAIDHKGRELVKLVDFGIAKLTGSEGSDMMKLTQTGDVFGSPLYMSPEQCQGGKLDERSDIYSLGCVIYESLTGMPPLIGQSTVATILKHLNEMPEPFEVVRSDLHIDEELEDLIFEAVEKDPEDRVPSMNELGDRLENIYKRLYGQAAYHVGQDETGARKARDGDDDERLAKERDRETGARRTRPAEIRDDARQDPRSSSRSETRPARERDRDTGSRRGRDERAVDNNDHDDTRVNDARNDFRNGRSDTRDGRSDSRVDRERDRDSGRRSRRTGSHPAIDDEERENAREERIASRAERSSTRQNARKALPERDYRDNRDDHRSDLSKKTSGLARNSPYVAAGLGTGRTGGSGGHVHALNEHRHIKIGQRHSPEVRHRSRAR